MKRLMTFTSDHIKQLYHSNITDQVAMSPRGIPDGKEVHELLSLAMKKLSILVR